MRHSEIGVRYPAVKKVRRGWRWRTGQIAREVSAERVHVREEGLGHAALGCVLAPLRRVIGERRRGGEVESLCVRVLARSWGLIEALGDGRRRGV